MNKNTAVTKTADVKTALFATVTRYPQQFTDKYKAAFEGKAGKKGKTPAKAAKKAKKAKKAVKAGEAKKHNGRRTYPLTAKITVLTKKNPKREGSASYKRFELYTKNHTVESFLKAGGITPDLNYDVKHGFIKVV